MITSARIRDKNYTMDCKLIYFLYNLELTVVLKFFCEMMMMIMMMNAGHALLRLMLSYKRILIFIVKVPVDIGIYSTMR